MSNDGVYMMVQQRCETWNRLVVERVLIVRGWLMGLDASKERGGTENKIRE